MTKLGMFAIWLAILLIIAGVSSCNKDGVVAAGKGRETSSGMQPGINYMQPLRWRVTYNYRVQDITPKVKFMSPRAMAGFEGIKAVGKGNYEVWFSGPREGEGVRDVKLISSVPPPTHVSEGSETEPKFYYYNFSPGEQLPDQISATLTWEFTTFERYTHWDKMKVGEYDKESALYKLYTKEEAPIDFEIEMKKVAKTIQREAKGDPQQTALGCYNYLLANFTYNHAQEGLIAYTGLKALADASRSWKNKHGVCDEFSTVYCSMLRSVGIPARPVAGFCHTNMIFTRESDNTDVRSLLAKVQKKNGPFLKVGGHGWAEFYLPDVGWVPVDPTWGDAEWNIPDYFSRMGGNRNISMPDYYFGKMDCMRIAMYKDWNYTLDPAPVTPGAKPIQDWMVGYTERTSGIFNMIHGWEGIQSISDLPGYGFYRSEADAGTNFEPTVELLGPVKASQIASIIDEVEEGGGHYVGVPAVKGRWPMVTIGDGFMDTLLDMSECIEAEMPRDDRRYKFLDKKVTKHFNPTE